MSLSAYSLISLEELKDSLSISGNAKDGALESILNGVSDEIEDYLGRQIITRGSLTEYHTMAAGGVALDTCELLTLEYPVLTVPTIHEDVATPRAYGASALLTLGTAYEIVKGAKPRSIIRRLNGGAGLPWSWYVGHRAIKVVYTAGYTLAIVPERIRRVALQYAAVMWEEQKRGAFGVSGASDALGNYTRFAAAQLTDAMKTTLYGERRHSFYETGERDA